MSDKSKYIGKYETVRQEGGHSCYEFDLRGCIEDELERAIKNRSDEINDQVNHPQHYTSGDVECIDAIRSALGDDEKFLAYCEGNVLKYIWRHRAKGGLVDLKKAKWYLDLMIRVSKEKKKKTKSKVKKVPHVIGGQITNDDENIDGMMTERTETN